MLEYRLIKPKVLFFLIKGIYMCRTAQNRLCSSISTVFILFLHILTITALTSQWVFTDQFTDTLKLFNYLHCQRSDIKLNHHSETLTYEMSLVKK